MSVRVFLLLLLLTACGRTGPGLVPEAERTDRPLLVFAEPGHDFGRQERYRTLHHVVIFENGGRRPLEIRRIDTHCGCAAALLSRRVIPPGGEGRIDLTFRTGSVPGERRRDLEIATNDPREPVSRYPVRCEVIGDAVLDPMVVAVRGTRSGGPVTAHFDVLALDAGDSLRILGISASHPGIRSTFAPLPPQSGRRGYRVTLTFGEELPEGSFHERVIVTTNSRRDPRLAIDVIGSLRREVLAVPERLYFPSGRRTTRSVFLSRRDGRPLAVRKVTDPLLLLEIAPRRVSPSRWEIELTLTGESPARRTRGSLVIETDAPTDSRIVIPYEIPGR